MAGPDNAIGIVPVGLTAGLLDRGKGGVFDARHTRDELASISNAGLNNIRIWPSFLGWMVDRPRYTATLTAIAQNCRDLGLSITFIVWNGAPAHDNIVPYLTANIGTIAANVFRGAPNTRLLAELWRFVDLISNRNRPLIPTGEPWFAGSYGEPGVDVFAGAGALAGIWPLMDAYLRDIAGVFTSFPGVEVLFSYDLFNEPDFDLEMGQARYPLYRDVTVESLRILRNEHVRAGRRIPYFTIGTTGLGPDARRLMTDVHTMAGANRDFYISSHAYREISAMASFDTAIRNGVTFARSIPPVLEYVCSEFWERRLVTPPPAPVGPYLRSLRSFGAGGQMWGFLEHNLFWLYEDPNSNAVVRIEAVDGVVRPTRGQWVENMSWPSNVISHPTGSLADFNAISEWAGSF